MPIARTEFSSGLRVVTERMPGVRSVALGIWVLAGSRDEEPAISGSSHFLEHLLFKGTRSRSALDIAQNFDAVGGDLNAFTAKEYTCFYSRVLDRDLPMAVEHLTDMLQHSLIRKLDLDAERQVILEEINMHEDSPEDVVHDAYISAWRGAASYRRERGNVRGWLLSIVHHRAVDVLRRKTTFRPAPLEAAAERASDDDTAEAATRNVEHQTVRAALEGLPQAQRRTIELAYFGGYTHVELAELMGVPLGTVKGRMRIGLQKLRRALELQGTYGGQPR